jgi:uncharacterized OB-fold protein
VCVSQLENRCEKVKTGLPVENVFEKFEDIKGVIISL